MYFCSFTVYQSFTALLGSKYVVICRVKNLPYCCCVMYNYIRLSRTHDSVWRKKIKRGEVPDMYCLNIKEEQEKSYERPIDAERLLRSLGASGRLVGFKYTVFIVERISEYADENYWLTKCIYPEAARRFNVSSTSVERAVRKVIESCWAQEDHAVLNYIAGTALTRRPTNSEFLDILAAFLRYKQKA